MSVNPMDGLCECPAQMYFFQADGNPRCRSCLAKCQTCQNEYSCMTYKTCTNPLQWLNPATGQCQFNCTAGYIQTCQSCNNPNCQMCDKSSTGAEICALCQNGYYLDLGTYTCVATCPLMSKAISSVNTQSMGASQIVQYCRPFQNNLLNNYIYYVNPNSTSQFELGTLMYPFKNMDTPAKEIFNFMYDLTTMFTVYHLKGTSMYLYYGVMPIVMVNVQQYTLNTYGDPTLPNPRIYVTGINYLWPDSTLFSLAESYYDFNTRVNRGDMSASEATTFFLKFNVFRSNLNVLNLDFQSIMFGDAWSNPLIFTFDAQNKTVYVENCYLDLDGAFTEGYFPISIHVNKSHFNLTNYQYGMWMDFRWDCYANNATNLSASVFVQNSRFTEHYQQALYNFIFISTFDDFIMRNNTFDGCQYLNMQTRPFQDLHPQTMCDPPWRTQNIIFDGNHFVNLYQSNLMFTFNYMSAFNGTKIFSMQNNTIVNSQINIQLISMQIQQPSPVTVGNNFFSNISVVSGSQVFYFFSSVSNITITNETAINNVCDDLYTIGAANNIYIKDFYVIGNNNTGAITQTSAIVSVSTANLCQVSNFQVEQSSFMYGSAIAVDQANFLNFSGASYSGNSLQDQDFLMFSQIMGCIIYNVQFDSFTKVSDKSRFALSFPTLTLSPGISQYTIKNITFSNSQSSFLSVAQVITTTNTAPSLYNFNITNCQVVNNSLTSKDTLITFGQINFRNFSVTLSSVNILNNVLQLGTIYDLTLNCRQLMIMNSLVYNNSGQFALLEPASSDVTNPLVFYLNNTIFIKNYAIADAMIQLTTNAIMYAKDSIFTENFSQGRGSVVFADYQAVYAYFSNCTFQRNYAYQGGVFYIQYSSQVEISNCTITQNFAVTGGVAYVNNDGQIKITNQTKVFKNSALNTCFLFLINTQFQSVIDNITITQNDQANALIPKQEFLSLNASYQFISYVFIQDMLLISDKVQRTVNELADSAVYAIKASVNFTNTQIFNNDIFLQASTESTVGLQNTTITNLVATGQVFQAVSSTIELYQVALKNITYSNPTQVSSTTSSGFYKITIVNKSIFRISNSTLKHITGLLLYVSGSTLLIDSNSTFYNTSNDDTQQSLVAIDTSTVSIQDSAFNHTTSSSFSPIFTMQSNTLNALRTSFVNFDKTLFQLASGNYVFDTLHISSGQMTWLSSADAFMVNSVVFDVATSNLAIQNSVIDGIFSNYSSPVIYIANDPTASSPYLLALNNSRFTNNVANISAGVILSVNTNLTVDHCLFENNSALIQDAGAMLLQCLSTASIPCSYVISNSVFKNNSAGVNGGAIEYTYYPPNTSVNNSFINNNAIYGSSLASYPVQMDIIQGTSRRRLQFLNQTQVHKLNLTNAIVFGLDTPLISGSIMTQNISLLLIDEYNRTMITDNTSVATMSSQSPSVTVMKSKSVTAAKGVFFFDDAIVVGPPGTSVLLQITADSINNAMISQAYPSLNGSLMNLYVSGYLRQCIAGEYQTTDYKCIVCADGFFTLSSNQLQCDECPSNAVCQDGSNIMVDQGYWRQSTNSINIFQCYNSEACLGGYNSSCQDGYGGNLCDSCKQSGGVFYSRQSSNNCAQCLDHTINAWRLAGVTLLIILYFILLIYINIKGLGSGQQKLSTVYMRILTNYFQILTLASSYDLSWTDSMKQFLQYISIISQSSDILFSVDCFLFNNNVTVQPIFVKMILACLFPLLCIGAVLIYWALVGFIRQNQEAYTKFIMSVTILIFMSLPQITTITFSIYNCIDIFQDGNQYLALDMSLQCWVGDHTYYSNRFGIPIIIIWIIGFPLVAFIILYRKQKKLTDSMNLARYGFIYNGLNHEAYYWEILLHFRKVFMIIINVFLTTFKPLYRALIGFMLMIVYIEFLQKVQPYQNPELNDLEFKANIAAFATFYGGLFFISSDLSTSAQICLLVLILSFNCIFWYSWIAMMFQKQILFLRNWLARRLCKGRFAVIRQATSADINELNNNKKHMQDDVVIEDGPEMKRRTTQRDKRKSKVADNTQILDESQRQELVDNDQSHRFDDEYEYQGKKHSRKDERPAKKKTKVVKRVEESESSFTNPIEDQSLSGDNKKSKDKPKKAKKNKQNDVTIQLSQNYFEDSISDSSISLSDQPSQSDNSHNIYAPKDKPKKVVQVPKQEPKIPSTFMRKDTHFVPAKKSTKDFGSSNATPQSSDLSIGTSNKRNENRSRDKNKNAGEMIDLSSSNDNNINSIRRPVTPQGTSSKGDKKKHLEPSPQRKHHSKEKKHISKSRSPVVDISAERKKKDPTPERRNNEERSANKKERSKKRKQSNTSNESPRIHPSLGVQMAIANSQIAQIVNNANEITLKNEKKKKSADSSDEEENSGFDQSKVHTAKYKKQMEKKGRNQKQPQAQGAGGRHEIDLSKQQHEDSGEQKDIMNRTVKPQEKLFANSKKQMEMTMQDFARKKAPYKKENTRHIAEEDDSSGDSEGNKRRKEKSKHRSQNRHEGDSIRVEEGKDRRRDMSDNSRDKSRRKSEPKEKSRKREESEKKPTSKNRQILSSDEDPESFEMEKSRKRHQEKKKQQAPRQDENQGNAKNQRRISKVPEKKSKPQREISSSSDSL